MQPDPDLQRGSGIYGGSQPQQPYQQPVMYAGGGDQFAPAQYTQGAGGPRTSVGIMLMALFSGLNILFLLVAAAYSLGMFSNSDETSNGASFFVVIIMTLIAGGLALSASFIGMRLSREANASGFLTIHKIMFVAVILLSVVVMMGPLFNK